MTAYGYRLFTIDAYLGRSRNELDFENLSDGGVDSNAVDELERHLRAIDGELLFGAATYRNDPPNPDEEEDEISSKVTKRHPYLRVRSVARSGQRIQVAVEYGREGDYEYLLSQDGSANIEMRGKATARVYRVWFLIPRKGTSGFVVSETRGRTNAAAVLVHWMRVQNQHQAVSFNSDGARSETPWVRWDVREAFDAHRIDEVLKESSDHAVTLRRRAADGAGNRTSGELRLTQQGIPQSRKDDIKEIISKWWEERGLGRTPERRREAAKQLGTLIGVSDALDKLDFNDGEITFSEKNKTQTISPNTIERLFVYPLGEQRPRDKELLGAALTTLRPMAEDLKIEIDVVP